MSKKDDINKGILSGLEEMEEDNKRVKEQKSKRVKKDKSREKLKRSYMLTRDTIKKLKLLQIQEVDTTLSEIVEEAIKVFYEKRVKE